ncbi:hypothetical protein ABZ297_34635 [Nonomuraea sp. NPDC005983]|uniref:hypothetical protein n=1 Tax=Nonomuraea sp. NPDC005983 TaxID=3155595 RepID=UPI0033A1936C
MTRILGTLVALAVPVPSLFLSFVIGAFAVDPCGGENQSVYCRWPNQIVYGWLAFVLLVVIGSIAAIWAGRAALALGLGAFTALSSIPFMALVWLLS